MTSATMTSKGQITIPIKVRLEDYLTQFNHFIVILACYFAKPGYVLFVGVLISRGWKAFADVKRLLAIGSSRWV